MRILKKLGVGMLAVLMLVVLVSCKSKEQGSIQEENSSPKEVLIQALEDFDKHTAYERQEQEALHDFEVNKEQWIPFDRQTQATMKIVYHEDVEYRSFQGDVNINAETDDAPRQDTTYFIERVNNDQILERIDTKKRGDAYAFYLYNVYQLEMNKQLTPTEKEFTLLTFPIDDFLKGDKQECVDITMQDHENGATIKMKLHDLDKLNAAIQAKNKGLDASYDPNYYQGSKVTKNEYRKLEADFHLNQEGELVGFTWLSELDLGNGNVVETKRISKYSKFDEDLLDISYLDELFTKASQNELANDTIIEVK